MRIGIVNDLIVASETLRRALTAGGVHEIVWTARDGAEAVAKCLQDTPDLVLMDLVMPRLDGVAATKRIMAASPCAILIVTASMKENTSLVYEALAAGAIDVTQTPDGAGGVAMLRAKVDWLERRILATRPTVPPFLPKAEAREHGAPVATGGATSAEMLVAIGASAGGPGALATLAADFPADFPGAIVVVQHIDPTFSHGLVSWLARQSKLRVRAVEHGMVPMAGEMCVATEARHLVLGKDGRLNLVDEPKDHVYRPSIDIFFGSMAVNWRKRGAGVLLTGMGRDGAAGLLRLRSAGFPTIAQDRHSSAVYGMPKAAAELGAASDILPLGDIVPRLRAITQTANLGRIKTL